MLDLPISEQAFSMLGARKVPKEKVFQGFIIMGHYALILAEWIGRPGITKPINFHCFRHTFATLQLSEGTDIYAVSKMLGHRYIKTTAIYTKVVDRLKQEAANRIKLDI